MISPTAFLFQIIQNPSNLAEELEQIPGRTGNPFGLTNMMDFLSNLLGWAIIFGGLIIFFCIIISGIQWMMAGGDKNSVQTAKTRLTNCLVGFAVLALTYAIALIVQFFFGITILQTPGGTYTPYEPPIEIATAPLPTLRPPSTGGGGSRPGSGPVDPTITLTPSPTRVPTIALPPPTGGSRITYPLDEPAQAPDYVIPEAGGSGYDLVLQDPANSGFEPGVGCGAGSYHFGLEGNGARSTPESSDDPNIVLPTSFAVAAWIQPDILRGTPTGGNIAIIASSHTYQLRLREMGRISAVIRVPDTLNPTGNTVFTGVVSPDRTYTNGEWIHVAMIYNQSDRILRLFANGLQVAFRENMNPPIPPYDPDPDGCPIMIGYPCDNNPQERFEGYIDEVMILTDTTVNPTQPIFTAADITSSCNPT